MPHVTSYEQGAPCWVDLSASDLDAAARFYGDLMGWTATEAGPPEQTGGYRFFLHDGTAVGGFGPQVQEGQPVAWTTYLAVADAEATAAAAREAGGEVLAEPMQITDQGRMAVLQDPTGAAVGIWQAQAFAGTGWVGEPGGPAWHELATPDPGAAGAFYERVFGAAVEEQNMGGMAYWMLRVGGARVAGMRRAGDGEPAHWTACFAVADCDATVAKAGDLGGTPLMPPTDVPPGRFGALADPQGATFQVIALA